MKVLFLDLASHSDAPDAGACIACVTDAKTEVIRFVDHRIGDDGLMKLLAEVLQEAQWTEKDLTHIACVTGPGGFTSQRVAVTLANVYSNLLHIPIAGIHLSDLWHQRVDSIKNRSCMWLHSTKKIALFVRGFGDYAEQWPESALITLEDLVVQLPERATLIGEILPEHCAAIAEKQPEFVPLKPIADVLPSFLSNLMYSEKQLTPWYGRGW